VTFILFVRKSGRITLTARDKFLIGKKYKYHYLMAVVETAKKRLRVISQGNWFDPLTTVDEPKM
jgi:hypothetical protein